MDRVSWERQGGLRKGTLVCFFKGGNAAAESASSALKHLATQWDAQRVGAIDPEEFFDFQVTRPNVRLTEGLTRETEWPGFVSWTAGLPSGDRDVAFLVGSEPNLRWK